MRFDNQSKPFSRFDYAKIIAFLFRYGHLECPFGNVQDIPAVLSSLTDEEREDPKAIESAVTKSGLTYRDECVVQAVRSYQTLETQFDLVAPAVHGGKAMSITGEVGPATEIVMGLERCGHPDYRKPGEFEPAVGRGNWPRCHGVGDFHAVSVKIANSPPSFLAPVFDEVKRRVTEAYAEVGLLVHWDGRSPINIDFSFVTRSSGWIGLAIVGNGQSCNDRIWCRYLSTYRGGSSDASITTQWTTLIKHELGHNCGMSHSRGGVMNPSIVNNLPTSWKGDPSESLLTSRFGGQRVPTGPGDDSPKWVIARKYPDGRYEDVTTIKVGEDSGGGWPT